MTSQNNEKTSTQTDDYMKLFLKSQSYYSRKRHISMQDKSKIKAPSPPYSFKDIHNWLKNPVQHEERLRALSNYLYNTNALYKWALTTVANMPTYAWKLSYDNFTKKKAKTKADKSYREGLAYVDKLNLQHNLINVFLTCLKEDWFYGYEIETDDNYFILPFDAKYCRAYDRNENGTYNFALNFSYFDDKKELLNSYPIELQNKYLQSQSMSQKWIGLDANKTFCVKLNYEFEYALPYYSILFPSLVDLDFYKDLKKDRAENELLQLFHQLIPMMNDRGVDEFAITAPVAAEFNDILEASVPERVGVITSPMPLTAVKMDGVKNDSDYVNQQYRDVYTDAGIPQHLSNADNNTSVGLSKAIIVMEQIAFRFHRQLELVVSRKLRHKFKDDNFKFRFLDITRFNQEEKVKMHLTNAQNGAGVMSFVSASGVSPHEFLCDLELENDILGLVDKMKPIKSSHTQSSEDEGGAPTKSDNNISDSGQKNKDADTDSKKLAR